MEAAWLGMPEIGQKFEYLQLAYLLKERSRFLFFCFVPVPVMYLDYKAMHKVKTGHAILSRDSVEPW